MGVSVVVGGSSGIGRTIAERLAGEGDHVVVTSRDAARAAAVAAEIGGSTRGLPVDLAHPDTIAPALASIEAVDRLVVCATQQAVNSVRDFDLSAAVEAVTVKLVGYTETVRVLRPRFAPDASVVLFGGLAFERPYPGSTMVSANNGGIASLVKTLALEVAPHRVNAVHPGLVGDSPKWRNTPLEGVIARTPIGRTVTVAEVVDATLFLLRNTGVNAHNLVIDGGTLVS